MQTGTVELGKGRMNERERESEGERGGEGTQIQQKGNED